MMDDYLVAEPLIVARLEEQLSDITIKSTWGMPLPGRSRPVKSKASIWSSKRPRERSGIFAHRAIEHLKSTVWTISTG